MNGPNLRSEKYTCCSRENPSLVQHVRSLRVVHNIWPPVGVPGYHVIHPYRLAVAMRARHAWLARVKSEMDLW